MRYEQIEIKVYTYCRYRVDQSSGYDHLSEQQTDPRPEARSSTSNSNARVLRVTGQLCAETRESSIV